MIDIIEATYSTGNIKYLKDVTHPVPLQLNAVAAAGYDRYYKCDESLREFAGKAAQKAILKSGLDIKDIDFIIGAHTGVSDFPSIDFSCQVGAYLGVSDVITRNIVEGCGSAITAFDIANGLIATDPNMTGIVVQAQIVSEAHYDRFSLLNGILSDAVVVSIVTPSKPNNDYLLRIKEFDEVSIPYYVDMMRIEYGGTMHPKIPAANNPEYYKSGRERLQEIYKMTSDQLQEFVKLRQNTMCQIIKSVTTRSGWEKPADWLFHTLEGERSIQDIARQSDIANHNAKLVSKHGHCGCADPLLSLIESMNEGSLNNSDRIILSTISSGMKWAAMSGIIGDVAKV
ncbi:3-oxoacyl-[acyl-carrier-protein] synthase III C-terminal domain-containing protein [Microbacterium foliorum]|uniref:3-oxoacyl-[acyl-carrier-protein] synthase III C-terminal domain-containing protein n=1 Tax=Rothia terrae TaxID=396015 RepID=UPI00343A7DD9